MKITVNPVNAFSFKPLLKQQGQFSFGRIAQRDVFIRTVSDKQFSKNIPPVVQSLDGLKSIITEGNELGRGFSHIAYDIPSENGLVLRIPADFDISKIKRASIRTEDCEDKTLDFNIGQKLASIYVAENRTKKPTELEVLKKQEGHSIGIIPFEVYEEIHPNDKNGFSSEQMKRLYAQSLETVASLPIEAYEDLIETVQQAGKHDYCFDFLNANNLLYDKTNQRLNIIDMEKGCGIINYGSLLFALTNAAYANTYSNFGFPVSEEEKIATGKNTDLIIEKFMQALENKGLKDEQDKCIFTYLSMFIGSIMDSNRKQR